MPTPHDGAWAPGAAGTNRRFRGKLEAMGATTTRKSEEGDPESPSQVLPAEIEAAADVTGGSLADDSGGSGDVYRATCRRTGEPVAVKIVRLSDVGYSRDDFNREARAHRAVKSPYVLPLLRYGVCMRTGFLVTPWCDAGSLAGLRIKPERLRLFASQAATGLEAIHSTRGGLAHGDVRPQNVLLRGGRVQLADFGLSWGSNNTGRLRGDPLLASRRQAKDEEVSTARSDDVAALGVVLGEALDRSRISVDSVDRAIAADLDVVAAAIDWSAVPVRHGRPSAVELVEVLGVDAETRVRDRIQQGTDDLRALLGDGEWRSADRATTYLLEELGRHPVRDYGHLAVGTLVDVDRLWDRATEGRHGIAAKSALLDELDPTAFDAFAAAAQIFGWVEKTGVNTLRSVDQMDFSPSAPRGHLPTYRDHAASTGSQLDQWRHQFTVTQRYGHFCLAQGGHQ